MNKLFTKPDSTLPTIRALAWIRKASRLNTPQSELIALAQATKAHYEKIGVTHYAKLQSGKVLKTGYSRQPIVDFIRLFNS